MYGHGNTAGIIQFHRNCATMQSISDQATLLKTTTIAPPTSTAIFPAVPIKISLAFDLVDISVLSGVNLFEAN